MICDKGWRGERQTLPLLLRSTDRPPARTPRRADARTSFDLQQRI